MVCCFLHPAALLLVYFSHQSLCIFTMEKSSKSYYFFKPASITWLKVLVVLFVVTINKVDSDIIFDEFPTADSTLNISEQCLKDSQQQLDAFRQHSPAIPWAVKSIKLYINYLL